MPTRSWLESRSHPCVGAKLCKMMRQGWQQECQKTAHLVHTAESTLAAYQATNLLQTINAYIHCAHIGESPELPRGTSASTDEGITIYTSPADCATDCQVRRDAILWRCWSNTMDCFTSSSETLGFICSFQETCSQRYFFYSEAFLTG